MANKTRLRKVMRQINLIAKDAPDNARWNQDAWWDGGNYIVGEKHELFQLQEHFNPVTRDWDVSPMTTKAGDPIKCDASGCFAGWAVAMFAPPGTKVVGSVVNLPNGDDDYIDTYAMKVLGLEEYDADRLFSPSNTLGDLREQVRRLTG